MSLSDKQISRLKEKKAKLAHRLASGGFGLDYADLLMQIGRYKELNDEVNVWVSYRQKATVNEESSMAELPDDEDVGDDDETEEPAQPPRRRLPNKARGWGG